MQNAKSLEEYISILKSEFVSSYDRNAHLYEALPNDASVIPEMSQKFGCTAQICKVKSVDNSYVQK